MGSEEESDSSDNPLLLTLLNPSPSQHKPSEENKLFIGDHEQQAFQLLEQESHYHLESISATITTRQLPSQGLSFQLWPAASTLVTLLDRHPASLLLPPPGRPSPLNILELGSGTGLAGIAAAAILGAHVTLTDLPHVIPNLRFNADANADLVASRGGSITVRQLTWGNEDGGSSGLLFDVVMASDVVYYEHLIDPLLHTLSRLVKGEVVFLMAHLRRWKKRDSSFFRKAKKLFDFHLLHTDPPLPGSRIGVAVYCFTAKKEKKNAS